MKNPFRFLTLLMIMAALALNVQAQQRMNKADRPGFNKQNCSQMMVGQRGPHHTRMMALLDLSDDQQNKIESIHLDGQKAMLTLRTTLQQKRAEMRTITIGDNYDDAQVTELANDIGELHARMLKQKASHQQQIKDILTEEQRVKFDSFHLNRGQNWGANRRGWNR